MNKTEHLLACLSEECAEVIKEVDKSLRFGLDDYNPNDKTERTNREKIHAELIDLMAVMLMLIDEGTIEAIDLMDPRFAKKREKVTRYMEYARVRGTLE